METIILSTKHLHFTDQDFYTFCMDNPELKFERTEDGKIIIMANTGGTTGRLNAKLIFYLYKWNIDKNLGEVFDSSTAFLLPNKSVRSPDAAWISKERWNALSEEQKSKFPPICPDFIVELKSTSDDLIDVQNKITNEWMNNGCKLAWLIDPEQKYIYVYENNKDFKILGESTKIMNFDILPGLEFYLSELFI